MMYPRYFGPTEIVRSSLRKVIELPTALIAVKANDGLVIAADGLSGRIEDDGTYTPISCHVQKIFKLEGHGQRLVWGVTGNADIRSDDGTATAFDIIEAVGKCSRHLLASNAENLDVLADRIGRCVNDAMRKVKDGGRFSLYPTNSGPDIFRLFIQGYYKERPAQCVRRFFHIDQTLQEPEDKGDDITEGRYLSGSGRVLNIILSQTDQRLATYKVQFPPSTVEQAAEFARKCVEVHMTAEARAIDEFHCRAIGGRTLIARIKKDHGIEWMPGFTPIDEKVY